MPKQLPKSDSNNSYFPRRNCQSVIRLYTLKKIWMRLSLLSQSNKLIQILISSLLMSHFHKWNNNLFIFQGSIQIPPGGQIPQCPRCHAAPVVLEPFLWRLGQVGLQLSLGEYSLVVGCGYGCKLEHSRGSLAHKMVNTGCRPFLLEKLFFGGWLLCEW